MARINYFSECSTFEELKQLYHELVKKHHPDKGGNLEVMQAINAEYDRVFPVLKNKHKNAAGEFYEKETQETPDQFRDLMETLIKFEGIHIEIIGSFIWVTGNTKPYKDFLKSLGFKWHTKKICWYKAPDNYRKYSKKEYSMSEIRGMFGVTYEADGQELKNARITA